jgi:hypothetical protein
MLFPTKVGAIEFDGETGDVRIAVVRVGRGLPHIVELQESRAVYDSPDARFDALVVAVDEAVGRLSTRPAAFVLCAPTRYSVVRTMTIPFRGRRKVAAAVPFELEPFLAFSIDELLVDFTVVSEGGGKTDVLAVGSRRELLDEQMAVLAAAGVETDAVGLDAAGLTALWLAAHKGGKGMSAVLHARDHGSILAITQNRTLAYFRHLSCTGNDIREAPSAMVREVQNSIRGFMAARRGEGAIERLHITGVALDDDQRGSLAQALGMEVEDEVLIGKLKGHEAALDAEGFVAADNVWEAAIGVALGAAGGANAFDFKRFERDWQSAARGVVTHFMFSACLGLLALLGWAFYCYQSAAQNNALAAKLEERIAELRGEVEALQQEGLPDISPDVMQVYRDPTLLEILTEMSSRMPENEVSVREIQVTSPGGGRTWLTIKGEAENPAAFNQAFANLRRCPFMAFNKDPKVTMEQKASFSIEIDRAEASADEQD